MCISLKQAIVIMLCALPALSFAQTTAPRENIPATVSAEVKSALNGLYDADPVKRTDAAYALGMMRGKAVDAIPFLQGMLQDNKFFNWQPPEQDWTLIVTSPGREAAWALSRIGPPAFDTLIESLKTPDQNVIGNAAWALGELNDPRAVDPLIKATRGWAHGEIAEALGQLGDPKAASVLVPMMDNIWVKLQVFKALRALGPASVDALIVGLRDGKVSIRANSATLLGEFKDRKATAGLITTLTDTDLLVRREAARALLSIADLSSRDALITTMEKDTDWIVRKTCAEALGALKDPRAIPSLTKALGDADITVRINAIISLGALGDPKSATALIPFIKDPNWYTRVVTAQALGALRAKDSVGALTAALTPQEDPRVLCADLLALGAIADPAPIAKMIPFLKHPVAEVRRDAAAGLGAIGAPAVGPLITFARSAEFRAGASDKELMGGPLYDALIAIGPEGAQGLSDLLCDGDWRVQVAAQSALVKIGEPAIVPTILALQVPAARSRIPYVLEKIQPGYRVVEVLISALGHPNAEFRQLVLAQLTKITGQNFGEDQAKWSTWWDKNLKPAVKAN